MKKIEVGPILTILANLGVVASLIFVGLQVRQEVVATRSATVLQLKDAWVQLNLASATSVPLADAFHAVETQGWKDADYRSRSLVTGFFRTLFHNWSNAYFQYNNGTLDESQWAPHWREIAGSVSDPVARQVWSEWSHIYDDSFRELLEGLIVESDFDAESDS